MGESYQPVDRRVEQPPPPLLPQPTLTRERESESERPGRGGEMVSTQDKVREKGPTGPWADLLAELENDPSFRPLKLALALEQPQNEDDISTMERFPDIIRNPRFQPFIREMLSLPRDQWIFPISFVDHLGEYSEDPTILKKVAKILAEDNTGFRQDIVEHNPTLRNLASIHRSGANGEEINRAIAAFATNRVASRIEHTLDAVSTPDPRPAEPPPEPEPTPTWFARLFRKK